MWSHPCQLLLESSLKFPRLKNIRYFLLYYFPAPLGLANFFSHFLGDLSKSWRGMSFSRKKDFEIPSIESKKRRKKKIMLWKYWGNEVGVAKDSVVKFSTTLVYVGLYVLRRVLSFVAFTVLLLCLHRNVTFSSLFLRPPPSCPSFTLAKGLDSFSYFALAKYTRILVAVYRLQLTRQGHRARHIVS